MKPAFAELVDAVRGGDQRSVARLISHVENRRDGYTDAVRALHADAGDAAIVGVTGSPGAGKSTLVDELVDPRFVPEPTRRHLLI
jgi:LAO/AO transport system kinase